MDTMTELKAKYPVDANGMLIIPRFSEGERPVVVRVGRGVELHCYAARENEGIRGFCGKKPICSRYSIRSGLTFVREGTEGVTCERCLEALAYAASRVAVAH
jgi:hypothetical protein